MSGDDLSRLDELRRALYRPDATEADRREYVVLLERLHGAAPPIADALEAEADDQPAAEDQPRRHRAATVPIAAVGTLAVVGLALTAIAFARSDPSPTETTSSAAATSSLLAEALAAPPPTPATLSLQRATVPAQHTSGSGSAVIPLLLDGAPRFGGTLVVAITSSDAEPVGWFAQRHRGVPNDTGGLERVASSAPAIREGAALPTVVSYSGAPPTTITVLAPEGTGWSITVAFTG